MRAARSGRVDFDESVPSDRATVLECVLAIREADRRKCWVVVVFVDRDPVKVPGCVVARSRVRGDWKPGAIVVAFKWLGEGWMEVTVQGVTDPIVSAVVYGVLKGSTEDVPRELEELCGRYWI